MQIAYLVGRPRAARSLTGRADDLRSGRGASEYFAGMRVRGVLAALAALLTIVVGVPFGAGGAEATPARDPVIIVAGTFAGQPAASIFSAPMAARLRADGYQPYIF